MRFRKKYLLSIEARSEDFSLADLTAAIGHVPSPISRSIGEARFDGGACSTTCWIYEIGTFDDREISEGWENVRRACMEFSNGFKNAMAASPSIRLIFNMGVINNTLSISAAIPRRVIEEMAANGIALEVTTYLAK